MKFPSAIHRLHRFQKRPLHNLATRLLLGLMVVGTGCVVALILFSFSAISVHAQSDNQPADQAENGYTYTVQRGDNWYSVEVRTGVSTAELQAANPQAVRRSGWLITGEKLFIPARQPVATTTYVVQRGESWSIIAKKFGISMRLLMAANPQAIRYDDVLRRNETLIIPLPEDAILPANAASDTTSPAANTSVATTTATTTVTTTVSAPVSETVATTDTASAPPAASEEAQPTPEPTATETATETPAETATPEPTTTETATETATPESTATETNTPEPAVPTAAPAAQCPSDFADYPTAILTALNETGGVEALQSFLAECNAASTAPPAIQDLTGDGVDDLVLLYQNPNAALPQPVMDLLILNGSADGFTIGHQARAESEINLLGALDINGDGQNDVAWIETTCGNDTCFDTVQIYSWAENSWRTWTATKITMANAETRLEDQSPAGQGLDIVLNGGEYSNPAAGPQRSRTELWGSVGGAPYTLLEKNYAPSTCLYHTVIDANAAFQNGATDNFAAAETLYTQAATDRALVACGTRENELAELQSFSLYRLALIAAYRGQPDVAADLIGTIATTYPDSTYARLGQSWLGAYGEGGNIKAACSAVTQYAESDPEASAVLGDYGYANPGFSAAEICPILDIAVPTPAPTETPASDGIATPTGEASEESAGEAAAAGATVSTTVSATVTATTAITTAQVVTVTPGAEAIECPTDLAGYVDTLPMLLNSAQQNSTAIESWLRVCNALDDQRGAFHLGDLNEDGEQDALFLPTIVSDRGVGPEGAQGAVLIYHGVATGGYQLAANPEIYGLPTLLTVEDLNADQRTDIAWSVEGCSTSCVSEVQIVTWNGLVYTSTIEPGATIAEGTATFTQIAAGDPGRGKQLVLVGGVSNTEESGLAVPHTEIWQSVQRQPFQRIRWSYDRTVEGANCLGLRLIEADVALQASAVLGYEPAINLYTKAIDPSLQPCSIFGMTADKELSLLQGLASFRLIQAHALDGDFVAAGTVLTSLSQGQPDSDYTKAAQQWLDSYETNGDAAAACVAIQPIFNENTDLWQITDHYGFNHPALAAEQVCYTP